MCRPAADEAVHRTQEKTPGTQGRTEEVNHQNILCGQWSLLKHFIVGSFYPGPFMLKEAY